jgi:ATP-dependent Clp protease ATP-binding subunit ClpC
MDNNQLNSYVKHILEVSREEADRHHSALISPELILLGILEAEEGMAVRALVRQGVNVDMLRSQLLTLLDQPALHEMLPASDTDPWQLDTVSDRSIKLSHLEAHMLHNDDINSEHILLAMLRDPSSSISQLLGQYNIDYGTLFQEVSILYNKKQTDNEPEDFDLFTDTATADAPEDKRQDYDEEDDDEDDPTDGEWQESSPDTKVAEQQKPTDTPTLNRFGYDLTKAAAEGKLDPVVGRQKEIERVAQIFTRRKKNNPILIGDPGVGKSAIVEGLAQRIANRQVSYFLQNKRLVSLDLAGMVAGTKYRGEFEARLKNCMSELRNNPDIIVFIDEIHTLIGAGNAAGGMDAANMLKPALSRGQFQCIGATTIDEYRKSIEKDGALERRFQKVMVEPTSAAETLEILHNLRDRYEEHHNVSFTDAALEACVKLTERYVTDRNFPDKAIDAMDEAGSRMHLFNAETPATLLTIERSIEEAKQRKDAAILAQQFEEAAECRDLQRQLENQLKNAQALWAQKEKSQRPTVDADQVAEVIAQTTGIPVTKVAASETEKLLNLSTSLKDKVIGQDKAIGLITKAIQRNRVGLRDPRKPIGTFLFLGPTGVGKTYLAKCLAEEMFSSADNMIRIDMTEYTEKYTVSRLIGAAPGYVGYDEGGQLTERVRRHPYSVVLFDEIEKAHPEIFNLMLQIFDEGHLTDSQGRKVSFKNTVIIMTSNVGSRQLKDFGTGIGFAPRSEAEENALAQGVVRKALQKTFSPEFINRIDDIIAFDQLGHEDIRRIVDLELSAFTKRISEIGYSIQINDEVRDFLARKGYDKQYGARPLKRAISTYIEDELTEGLLRNQGTGKRNIMATMPPASEADRKPVFEFTE